MPTAKSRLTIDLDALAANYRLFRDRSPGSEVAPVVKADAYGLGAAKVAARLWAEGARSFHVARLEEGEALRAHLGPMRPATIYVLDGATSGSAARLIAAELIPILSSVGQVEAYRAYARADAPLRCGLHVDTGMNRLGLRGEEAEALAGATDRLDRLKIELLISHLACAEDEEDRMNARQAGRLKALHRLFPQARASLANSAGFGWASLSCSRWCAPASACTAAGRWAGRTGASGLWRPSRRRSWTYAPCLKARP